MRRRLRSTACDGDNTWHRDGTGKPVLLRTDGLRFGGWINADGTKQKFRCVPGTHHDDAQGATGFSKLCVPDDRDMRDHRCTPRYIVVFFQTVAHGVVPLKDKNRAANPPSSLGQGP